MVNFGTESAKDELIVDMADMIESLVLCKLGCGPDNVSENDAHQLVKKARGMQSSDKTVRHIGNALFGGRNGG